MKELIDAMYCGWQAEHVRAIAADEEESVDADPDSPAAVNFAEQFWIELGTVVRIEAITTMKCLIDGFYRFSNRVGATAFFVASSDCYSLFLQQFAVVQIANSNPGRSCPAHTNTSNPLPSR